MSRAVFVLLAMVTELPASKIRLVSHGMEVKLDSETGYGITSIRDAATGREFISSEAKLPLYRITLSRADGSSSDVISATASSASVRQTASGATLVFEHAKEHLQITCAVRADSAAPGVLWKIAIHNTGEFRVRSLFYPQWPAPLRLSSSPGQNRLLYPFLDGQEFIDPGEHMPVGRAHRTIYPGQAALQLMAYHDAVSGLLEMTKDGGGWLKHFRVARINGALDLSIEHNPDETPGKDIDLPYDTVLELFRGTWQDAADVYAEWALQQKWAKKITDRNPPHYLAEGLPIVTFAMRGDPYSAEWSMYFPPSNRLFNPDFHPSRIPALEARYAEFFDSKVITNPFGWEHIAPWIAGDYFPPYGGESLWAATATALRNAGSPLFMLLSGSRWGVNMDDVGYHERDRFLKDTAPHAAAYDSSGHPTEEDPPWAGSVQLCIGTPFAREHILDAFTGCVKRGASIVQYDQNHGGMAFVCYNRQHPHPPGYGRWMVDETEKLFRDVRAQCQRINPEFALAVEEPCEYFIPYWEIYMGRPYNFFGTGSDPSSDRLAVPLFIYVYHQYLLGYGGSNEIDVAHPYAEAIKVARKFTNGTLLDVDPGKPAFRLDSIPSPTDELRLARSCSRALRTYARPYLISGKMMRDPEIRDRKVESIRMWRDPKDNRRVYDLPAVDVPLVLESTWEADGRIGYVFANWQTSTQTVVFAPRSYGPKAASYGFAVYSDEGRRSMQEHGTLPGEIRIEVPALAAILVEQTQ
jgi:Domain of unknown function (DUF6259)